MQFTQVHGLAIRIEPDFIDIFDLCCLDAVNNQFGVFIGIAAELFLNCPLLVHLIKELGIVFIDYGFFTFGPIYHLLQAVIG